VSFDLTRLGRGERIIGVSAVLFFVVLFFFKWFGGSATSSLGSVNIGVGINGWHAFHVSRWVWLLTIVAALAAVVIAAGAVQVKSPVAPGAIVAGLGALSSLLILYRIVHHPHNSFNGVVGNVHVSASEGIRAGIWLGLLAALGITYGGYEAMRSERAAVAGGGAGTA
jgi:hypothetical protein